MAESCLLEELNISFCYKLQPLTVDTLVSTLNAKGPLRSIDLMAISFGDFTVEFISSCHLMSHLFIAGVSINDNEFDTVSFKSKCTDSLLLLHFLILCVFLFSCSYAVV